MKKIICHLDEIIISVILVLICVVLLLQVIFRRVLNSPLIWSEELARYLMVTMTMLAFSYNIRTDNNISVELLYNRFPKRVQKCLAILTDVMALVMYGWLLPYGVQYTRSQIGVKSSTMQMPMILLSGAVLLGLVLAVIQVLWDIARKIRGKQWGGE